MAKKTDQSTNLSTRQAATPTKRREQMLRRVAARYDRTAALMSENARPSAFSWLIIKTTTP